MSGGDTFWTNEVAVPSDNIAAKQWETKLDQRRNFRFIGSGIDPLAFIFFCLSRYEEYQTDERDEHGRFAATQSHAFQCGYLEQLVVNEVVSELAGVINTIFKNCHLRLPAYQLQLTYDIDIPYAYRLRGARGLASGIKDVLTGYGKRGFSRFATLLQRGSKDPYDVYDWLATLHQKYQIRPRYFWLLASRQNRFDPNPSPDTPELQALIGSIAQRANIGIHPSYYSSTNAELFAEERDTLRQISQKSIEHTRQHFLRFNLPITYRHLLRAGLRHDHSMGYADHVGFRAGTNLPFYWYDLEREEHTYLRIYPFAAMDVTLRRYHQLSYFASQEKIEALANEARRYGGPFTLLWHNSSFAADYGWEGWREMYAELISRLAET